MEPKIKIYVSCHKELYVPAHPLFHPIQAGAALCQRRFASMLHDDTGDNISIKNKSYCELTAQYWAWKNVETGYYGFFHYRRYLNFDGTGLHDCPAGQPIKNRLPRPYQIYYLPDDGTLKKLGYDLQNMVDIISRYDVIAPVAEEMHVTVYDHYKYADAHYIEDLELALAIIAEKYPDYHAAAKEYMNSTRHYFCNLFIMEKELFHLYCTWLFDILNEFDRRTDLSQYSGKAGRVDGFLGERLFGVYYTWLKKQRAVRWAELPRAHFAGFPGETDNFIILKRINAFLPPGTRRRAWVKKLYHATKGLLRKDRWQ